MMALNGLQLLLDSDSFELTDTQDVLRVLAIQVCTVVYCIVGYLALL